MWTREQNKQTGLHEYSVYTAEGELIERGIGFEDYRHAEHFAQLAERRRWLGLDGPREYETLEDVFAEMSDDELVRELLS